MNNNEFQATTGSERIEVSALLKGAYIQFVHFCLAGILGATSIQVYFSPLGLGFCCGTQKKYTFFSCLGAMLGYIVACDFDKAFRYVMTLILVYTLKLYVNSFIKAKNKPWINALCGLIVTTLTGVAFIITTSFTSKDIFMLIAEVLATFGVGFVFSVAFSSLNKLKERDKLTPRELTFLVISILTIILSAYDLRIFGISPAGIACSYTILTAAYLFRESGGAIIGTGASMGFALTGLSSFSVLCYGVSGLFAGLFSYSGRILCAFSYIFAYGASYLYFSDDTSVFPLIETAIATLFFVLTPHKTFVGLKNHLGTSAYSGEGQAVRNMFVSQLSITRNAMSNVTDTLSKANQALQSYAISDTTEVYLRVRDKICSSCASYPKCWGDGLSSTIGEFDEVVEEIRRKGSVTPSFTPMSLQSRCIRIMALCDSFNKNYASYSAHIGAEGKLNEMRKITTDQFDTFCQMLDDLLTSFEKDVKPLASKSEDVKNSLQDIGVNGFVNCYEDEELNMMVNISVDIDCPIVNEDIASCVSKTLGRDFSSPAIITGEKKKNLMLWEEPLYTAECIYHQISSTDDEVCGDCFDSFFDGKGNFIAVLSDGMGTGSRAAIDGAMTASLLSRLIISGFSFSCALRLVNSAMLVKCSEESLATLDILKLNLYNGKSSFYKAGATVSLLYRNGKVSEIKKSAMPIGILRQAEFATVRGGLREDDLIVILSDGADESIDEIKTYIQENGFSYDLPEKLCAIAKSRNFKRHDDITVAVIKVGINEN